MKRLYFSPLKIILTLIIFLTIPYISFASQVCNVNFNSQGGDFKSLSGATVFFIDSSGNIVIPSQAGSASGSTLRWFQGNNNLIFGTQRSRFNNIFPNSGSISTTGSGFIIRNNARTPIAFLGTSGDIQSRGHILYDQMGRGADMNQPSSCPSDGWSYCATSNRAGSSNLFESSPNTFVQGTNAHAENRDYFCNVNSVTSGLCRFDVLESESCYFEPYFMCSGRHRLHMFPQCSGGGCGEYVHNSQDCGTNQCLQTSSYSFECNCNTTTNDDGDEITTCETCTSSYCSRMRYRWCEVGGCQTQTVNYVCDSSGCS